MNRDAIRAAAVTIVRHLLSVASGGFGVWASKHGFNADGEIALLLGALALFIVNVLWAVGTTLIRKWKLDVALDLDSSATHDTLNTIAAKVPTLIQISEVLAEPSRRLTKIPLDKEGIQ